jgi:hypothetical protein
MANYLKATDFAAKDALLTGDPNKIVKGTEINDEFDSIQTAVNSKANSSSPTFTGTPAAPTATLGTNTTQVATTAFVIAALYPVGSIYLSTLSTSPATLFGFGTWAAFGAGKVLVGQDTGDAAFDVLEETGGSKDATLPSHTHTTAAAGAATGAINTATFDFGNIQSASGVFSASGSLPSRSQGSAGTGSFNTANLSIPDHEHTINSAGSSATNANLQPYVVVKMWKRTA